MIVQGLGLVWSLRDLLKDLDKGDNSKLLDRLLSVADGSAGVIGGALDLRAAGLQMQMVSRNGVAAGAAMARVSGSLSRLRAGAALAGVAGGLLNMVMSFRKAQEAERNGDVVAYVGHATAGFAFALNGIAMRLIYRNIVTRGATNLALGTAAQQVAETLLKKGLQRVFLTVLVGMSAEVLVAGVASVVSGTALLLLVGGVVATVWAVLAERTELQRWIARGYFGRDGDGRYTSIDMELQQYEQILGLGQKAIDDQEIARLLKAHPAPLPQPALDPWDPMNNSFGRAR